MRKPSGPPGTSVVGELPLPSLIAVSTLKKLENAGSRYHGLAMRDKPNMFFAAEVPQGSVVSTINSALSLWRGSAGPALQGGLVWRLTRLWCGARIDVMANSDLFEILALAMVAGVIIFRLYTVLGRRTGNERPPQDRFQLSPPADKAPVPADNVVALPLPAQHRRRARRSGRARIVRHQAGGPQFRSGAFSGRRAPRL